MSGENAFVRTGYGWKKPLESGDPKVKLTLVALDPLGNTGNSSGEFNDLIPGYGDKSLRGHTGTKRETARILAGGDATGTLLQVARDKNGFHPQILEHSESEGEFLTLEGERLFWHNCFNPSNKVPLLVLFRAELE